MFDPNEIIIASQSAHQCGQDARQRATAAFMVNTPDMSVPAASNASNIIDAVHANGQQLLGSLTKVKSAIDSQVSAHQQKQGAQVPANFSTDMKDLRPTNAQGFPKESQADFMSAFKF